MSKRTKDFKGELSRLGNRPKGRFLRAKRIRSTAEDFFHLVKRFPRDAAQSQAAMKMVDERFNNPADAPHAYNAIQYLFNLKPELITANPSFGLALTAIIHNGYPTEAKEFIEKSVRQHPQNIAANPSIAGAFQALIKLDESETVGSLANVLAINAPYEFSDNSSVGLIIADMLKSGQIQNAVDTFIILAKLQPTRFAENKTLKEAVKAFKAFESTNPGDMKRIFGESKAGVLYGHIAEMVSRASRNLKEI